jgi:hypothetical protein
MSNINWVLCNSTSDINYKDAIPKLTDAELRYCLANEPRKSGLTRLEREAKKRNLQARAVDVVTVPLYTIPWYQDKPAVACGDQHV